jgi:hypothetical protein
MVQFETSRSIGYRLHPHTQHPLAFALSLDLNRRTEGGRFHELQG